MALCVQLGPQGSAAQPSTVHDNYIHDQCNLYGCLYHVRKRLFSI